MDQCVKSSRSGKKKRDAASPPTRRVPPGRQRRPRNADLPHLDERPPLSAQLAHERFTHSRIRRTALDPARSRHHPPSRRPYAASRYGSKRCARRGGRTLPVGRVCDVRIPSGRRAHLGTGGANLGIPLPRAAVSYAWLVVEGRKNSRRPRKVRFLLGRGAVRGGGGEQGQFGCEPCASLRERGAPSLARRDWQDRAASFLQLAGPRFMSLRVERTPQEFLAGTTRPIREQLARLKGSLSSGEAATRFDDKDFAGR